MKLLLDTHIFFWFISSDARLPTRWHDAIDDPDNDVYLSAASAWEIVVKHQIGKLPLPQPPEHYIPMSRRKHQIESLDLDEAAAMHLTALPMLHRDPFDRILLCQALQHGLTLVTDDHKLTQYAVAILK